MRLATLRRARTEDPLPGVHGAARVGPAADRLAGQARRGDIAVIEHLDLDAGSARLLVAAGVGAVVNAAPSISGRYPNLGPQVLVAAGIPVLDRAGAEVMRLVGNGDRLRLDGETLFRGETPVATGQLLDADQVARQMEQARAGLTHQLEAFANNTVEHLRRERDLLLDGEGFPDLETEIAGRPVVVVSTGPGATEDLHRIRHWIREARPVLVGVDEGADTLVAAGLVPDLVVGNPERVVEEALVGGPEVVVRVDRTARLEMPGQAPGLDRADALGARTVVFPVTGSAEDAALLLVHAREAALIVGVGTSVVLADFVDRSRADMAGTFLTRLTVGAHLVDPATVAQLHHRRARTWPLWLLLLVLIAGLAATVALAGDTTTVGQWRDDLVTAVSDLVGGS
jgi:uncharacterized membrane-anchored protein